MTIPPQRPDQRQAALSRAGSGPAPQTNVFAFVIIAGPKGQLLVYSPTPGAGNLIASISGANGTDPYGNAYIEGFTTYVVTGVPGNVNAANLFGADLSFLNSSTGEGGPYGTVGILLAGPDAYFAGSDAVSSTINFDVTGTLAAKTQVWTPKVVPVTGTTGPGAAILETVHQITAGFPAGWSGTISYWITADGVSPRVTIDYHLTIANTTVVTNNEALGVSVASGYFYPTDNKFVFGQINGGGLAGNQFAPLRIDNTGGLHYSGPGFTATSSAFWYGGHTYAIAV